MKNFKKTSKKVLSLLLTVFLLVGTVGAGLGGLMSLKASAAQSHTIIATTSGKGNLYQDEYSARSYPTTDGKGIIVPDDDEVRILHVGDVQATAPLYEDLVHLIREGIARIKPHLIVLTGDNAMYTSTDDSFRNTIGNIVEYFYDENGKRIPFATTFGNHDTHNNKYSDDNDGAGKEVQAQWYYYTKWQGGIDFDYSDVADYGTGCINVYAANGSTIKQKVLMMNTAVDDDRGGYGKMGYSQTSKFNDEPCYDELCTKIAAEVNSANSIGAPVIAFQHIPLREMYTANGIVKSSTSSGINAYGSIKSDLVMPSSASANAGTKVTSLKFWPDTNPNSKWGDEITDGYCIGVMGETICCSYSSTEKIYRILANHPNTESGYTAHNNVKGIFYGHDHSNTVTGVGYINYGSERYTLTQGYAGGMDLQHSGSEIPYISAYIVKDDVTQNLRKYTWDPLSILEDYNVTFGAKYTVSGVPSTQTYVCDIAFGTKGANIFKTVKDLTSDAASKAEDALKNKGYSGSDIVKIKQTVDGKSANLNYAGEAGTVGDTYIAMAYATTTDVSKAYTDIIIKTGDSSRPETITKEKYGTTITYHLVSTQDLAAGTGGDDWNYCYATTDPIAGPPITALGVTVGTNDDFGLDGGWYQECLRHYSNGKWFQDPGDCNSGCGSGTNDVVILTKTIGSPANDNKHCLDSNVTKNYDITNQYFDLAKTYKEYSGKADKYRYTTESWDAFVAARNAAKALKEKIDVNRYITETKAQIEKVTDDLVAAYNALEEKPSIVSADQATATTNTNDAPVIIAVPETIYLQASSGKATKAQYYLNNSYVNGKLTAETGSSTQGKFSISAKGADSVKITTRQLNTSGAQTSGLSMSDSGNKNLTNGTATYTPQGTDEKAEGIIGGLSLNPGLDSNTTGLIEWQFDVTYQRDDIDGDEVREPVTLTYYAYSVLYAPYNKSVGSNIEANTDPQQSSSNSGIAWYTVWISGINGLKHRDSAKDSSKTPIWENSNMTDGSAYQYASLLTEPMTDSGALYKYTGSMQWHSQQDSSKIIAASNDTANMNYVYRYWYSTSSSSRKNTNAQYGGNIAGIVYVDSSRYTNYSQIPNFKVGTDCHRINAELGDDRVGLGYDLGSSYNDNRYGDSSNTAGNADNVPNTYFSLPNKSNAQSNLNQIRKTGTVNKPVSTANTKLSAISSFKIRVQYKGDKYNFDTQASTYCDISYLTKSTLRELVGAAYNSGLQEKWDTNSTFNTFKTQLMQAALKLGTPTDTTNSASALTTAQTNCANGQIGNGTIVNKNYGFRRVIDAGTGTTTSYQTKAFDVTSLGKNTTGTATKANWFLTQWADLSNYGYTYIGSKRASELAATVTGNTASALGLVTQKSQLKSEYMVSERANLNAYHYYLSPDYTLTIDPDGGTIGNGYTSVIGNEGSTLTGSTGVCTKTGYEFAGWQLVSGGGSVSGMTYTFGASDATIKALWRGTTHTVTFDPNKGIYNGNIVYLQNGDETATDTFSNSGGSLTATNNGANGISINATGISTTANSYSNQKIRAYLEYGKSYTLSYTSTVGKDTNGRDKAYFYILGTENKMVKPGEATTYSNSLIIKNRQGTVCTDNGDGTYTYTLNFTVGTGDGSYETNWNRMQTPSDATMEYYLRLDYNNAGVDHFTINNLKIVPTSDATVKIKARTDDDIFFSEPTRQDYTFDGWTVDPADGVSITGTGVKVGTADTTTLTASWLMLNIVLNGMDTKNVLDNDTSVTVTQVTKYVTNETTGESDPVTTNVPSSGKATVEGNYVDLSVEKDGSVSYTPKNMKWSEPESFTLKLSNDEEKPLKVYPQTTILYEETAGTFGYDDGNTPASTAGFKWQAIGSEAVGTSKNAGVYGYSNAYNIFNNYSNGTAYKATVSAGETVHPTYTFEFTGTGVDILTTANNDSGLMLIDIYYADEARKDDYVVDANGEDVWNEAINTHCTTPIYQEVACHYGNLVYDTYKVVVSSMYSKAFDLTDKTLNQAGFDTVVPEEGSIIDLSAELGEGHSRYVYHSMDNNIYSFGDEDIIDFEPDVVQKVPSVTEATEGNYSIIIDGVRVYEPGDTSISELAAQYERDEEINPKYEKLTDVYEDILKSGKVTGTMFVEGKDYSANGEAAWADYIDNGGSNNELELRPSSNTAVAFSVSNYERIHISFRAAKGIACTAVVNGHNIPITSTTEQYFDVTDFIDSDGDIAISCTGGDGAMLAICSIKTFAPGFAPQSADEEIIVFDATDATLLNAEKMFNAMLPPEAEEMTFTVDFGDAGTAETTVAADKLTVEKVGTVWTARVQLTGEELNSLFAEAENSKNYTLDTEDGIILNAIYEDGKWAPETAKVSVTENAPETDDTMTFTVNFGAAGTAEATVSKDKITVEKIDGVWTAKAQLTNEELNELFAEAENSKDYRISGENGITLTATYADEKWTAKTAEVTVTKYVYAKLIEKEDSSTVIDGQFIYGLMPSMTKADFENDFVNYEGDVTIEYSTDDEYIGTGTKVRLVSDGICGAEYTIVIFGDTNGDGRYDASDAVIANCIAAGMKFNDAVNMAADCNHDGVVNDLDVKLLEQAGIILSGVDQTKSVDELLQTDSAFVEYLNLIDQSFVSETEEDAGLADDSENTPSEKVADDEAKTEDTTEKIRELTWFEKLVKAVANFLGLLVERITVIFKA